MVLVHAGCQWVAGVAFRRWEEATREWEPAHPRWWDLIVKFSRNFVARLLNVVIIKN